MYGHINTQQHAAVEEIPPLVTVSYLGDTLDGGIEIQTLRRQQLGVS